MPVTMLAIEPAGWRDFIAEVKAGQHDLAGSR
jgi:hypothetical protein